MECAIETIAERGFAQASIGQIAKRAGISKGVVSYHFSSKEELMHHIVTALYVDGAAFMSRIAEETTPASMLRSYIETNLAFIGAHKQHVAAVMEIVWNARTEDGKLLYAKPANDAILVPLEAIIRWGQEEGSFRAFSEFGARVMAMTIRNAIDRAGSLLADPAFDIEAYTLEMATLFDLATRRQPD
ncbi:TetR/AcrR family transcriptional regulator [Paenibacillus sepulcri]